MVLLFITIYLIENIYNMYKLHVNLVSTKLIFLTYVYSLLSVNNSYNSYIDVNYDIVHSVYYIKYKNL